MKIPFGYSWVSDSLRQYISSEWEIAHVLQDSEYFYMNEKL